MVSDSEESIIQTPEKEQDHVDHVLQSAGALKETGLSNRNDSPVAYEIRERQNQSDCRPSISESGSVRESKGSRPTWCLGTAEQRATETVGGRA